MHSDSYNEQGTASWKQHDSESFASARVVSCELVRKMPKVLHQTLECIGSAERETPLFEAIAHGPGTNLDRIRPLFRCTPEAQTYLGKTLQMLSACSLRVQLAGSLLSCLRHMGRATRSDMVPCRLLWPGTCWRVVKTGRKRQASSPRRACRPTCLS